MYPRGPQPAVRDDRPLGRRWAVYGSLDARRVQAHQERAIRREELQSVQLPLKDRYRDDPGAALVTLTAQGTLGDGITCSVATGRVLAEAGLHPATGGDGLSVCSGDMLLQALAACAGVTLGAVATSLEIPLHGGRVLVEGDLDFRGTLAVERSTPVGFTAIRVRFELDSDAGEEKLATLVRLTERYCVVLQTLTTPAAVSVDCTTGGAGIQADGSQTEGAQAAGTQTDAEAQ